MLMSFRLSRKRFVNYGFDESGFKNSLSGNELMFGRRPYLASALIFSAIAFLPGCNGEGEDSYVRSPKIFTTTRAAE